MAGDLDDRSIHAGMSGELFSIVTGGFHHCDPTWDGGWKHEAHSKIYIPQSGRAHYDVGGGEFALRPGRIYLLPGGRRHRWRCPRRMTVHWMHVRVHEPRLERLIQALPSARTWTTASLSAWRPAWLGLSDFLPARPLVTLLRVQALLAWIAADMVDSAPAPSPAPPLPHAVARALAFLDEHHRRRPPLAAIARAAGLSPIHFHRVFVAAMGVTPHAWAERRRLDTAREMLAVAEMPVAEVASRCGYADPFHFSRAFRRANGLSPSAWRRALLAAIP